MTYAEVTTARLRETVADAGRARPCASPAADPEEWFPIGRPKVMVERRAAEAEASRLCASCPVRAACLELALRYESGSLAYGIWGGQTPWQREEINPYRRRTAGAEGETRTEEAAA